MSGESMELLNADGRYSDYQIAEQMGISRVRVHQIAVVAIRKCRKWCADRNLSLEDLILGHMPSGFSRWLH